jgi:prepilin-type N-terminal cleavage/methylation domain-containing protein
MRPKLKNHGFSLIEIIVVISLGAAVAAMLIPYMMTTTTNSAKPIRMLSASFNNQSVIENIIEDYTNNYTTLTDLQSNIGLEANDQDNDYGVYSVIDNHFVKFVLIGIQYNEEDALSGDPETEKILKISIRSANGGRITKLFPPKL